MSVRNLVGVNQESERIEFMDDLSFGSLLSKLKISFRTASGMVSGS